MTQIRVHELASELSVSTQQVLTFLEGLGKKVRGPSTVIGVSAAAKVRSRFRGTRPGDARAESPLTPSAAPAAAPTAGETAPAKQRSAPAAGTGPRRVGGPPAVATAQSLFLPPVAPPVATAFAPSAADFADPFALPAAGPAFRAPAARAAVPVPPRTPAPRTTLQRVAAPAEPVVVPAEDVSADWRRRGFDANAQEIWCTNGIRSQDAALADRCRSTGIAPADLPRKLSGRTVLQRLRDGESTTSVWARIQEAEQAPRRAGTKLTGRFQLS